MSEEKLRSDEVPGKFTEWLLAMGCPVERVPSVDIIAEMCRGQYYMVWRSLIEQVDSKDVIRNKRLQVFCDDVKRCQKKNAFSEPDSKTLVPEQLALWRQQTELRGRVWEAKERVALAQRDLNQLTDKIDSKMCQRDLLRRGSAAAGRRAWFLRQVAAELTQKTLDLQETRSIADSIYCFDTDTTDLESKLDKCIEAFRRQSQSAPAPQASLSHSTSVVSNSGDNDLEEQVWRLALSGGAALGALLYARRAALLAALSAPAPVGNATTLTPQSVLAHTAALHCTLYLEATKNKLHLKQTTNRLSDAVADLNKYLSGESCELLVLRCERAHLEARVDALRSLLDDMSNNQGVFATPQEDCTPLRSVASVDKEIELKKGELKRVMCQLASGERAAHGAAAALRAAFAAHTPHPHSHHRGIEVELPSESITEIRQFFTSRREARRQRIDLSMELELSDGSLTDLIDMNNPSFVDELRFYLTKFNLDKNRQLVFESGEKVWIFDTIQASIERLHTEWLNREVSCALLAPADSLSNNIGKLVDLVRTRRELEDTVRNLKCGEAVKVVDITPLKQEEEGILDKVKKRLRENQVELEKVSKTFAASEEHLRLWADNTIRRYISPARTVDGMKYKDYESYYLENCLGV